MAFKFIIGSKVAQNSFSASLDNELMFKLYQTIERNNQLLREHNKLLVDNEVIEEKVIRLKESKNGNPEREFSFWNYLWNYDYRDSLYELVKFIVKKYIPTIYNTYKRLRM